ncbi:MAG: YidC/Oxa1 family membrane protein insertase [Oscillospiraceae bacterium]|nr:YidC/Oxa1 family membrane protein insertase [Oscillospiraceae bacterium]
MFEAIARPFGMLIMFLYDLVQNYGVALILVAVVIKVVLLPFQMKGKRGQLKQSRLQPKMAELQKKHGANKQKLQEETAKLYREEGVNPASGCLWTFIQMPIMIALFFAIRQPLTIMMGLARDLFSYNEYGEPGLILQILERAGVTFTPEQLGGPHVEVEIAQAVSTHWSNFAGYVNPGQALDGLQDISFYFFSTLNLAETPRWDVWEFPWGDFNALLPLLLLFLLPIISGGAQFISAAIMRKMNVTGSPEAAGGTMGKVMMFMPLMSVWFGFILPAALSLYWTIGTVLQIGQDIWLTKKYTKILDAEDAEKDAIRKVKEAELEAKRLETERKKAEGTIEENLNTSKKKKKKKKSKDKDEKAAVWEKKNAPPKKAKEEDDDPSRVGKRRYARGRAYDPDRYPVIADDDDSSDDIEKDEDLDASQAHDVDDEYVNDEDEEITDSDEVDDDSDDSDEEVDDENEKEDSSSTEERFDTKRFD